ncbi:UNC-like C-terminal-domain-containing protein [Flammula alnicola]|nr:UNC-like C-terminal-domain-containing protein [Flammula alnicola]
MLSALPATLLALLFASPVFSQPTSLNDQFRALALKVPKQPENPICCLKPLTPSEPVDDGILLSFEEWKMKQLAMQTASSAKHNEEAINRASAGGTGEGNLGGDISNTSETVILSPDNSASTVESANAVEATPEWTDFSYLKVPTTDRFNYASLDCSARVHTSHRSAKSPSSILTSKRDRYMLSPCDTPKEQQFVVVELCDDIRIDTVQLANFEFFSGVFKDFTVSVAKRYPTDPDGWTVVRSYRAKNIRGVQTFHTPTSLRDFYRFVRIDFHSHYGNEYYCPVSLLRVYGLTHLEEWKWDIWESESRAKQAELQKKRQLPSSTDVTPPPPISSNVADATMHSINEDQLTTGKVVDITITSHVIYVMEHRSDKQLSSTSSTISYPSLSIPTRPVPSHFPISKDETPVPTGNDNHQPTATNSINDPSKHTTDAHVSSSTIAPPIPSPSSSQDKESERPIPENSTNKSSTFANTTTINSSISHTPQSTPSSSHSNPDTPTIVVSTTSPSVAVVPIAPLPPIAKGGESIYRTIMNRLVEVETNQTLYMRYVEQQNLAIRDVIKRLGEDVGRLEGITRAQSLTYQRTVNDWEKQRYQLEMEYVDLVSRIENLSEEIVLEKRLGVAQLCLLLAVLVFMGLTRGSRAEALIDHGSTKLNRSVREWGRRHFKLSGDWTGRFKGKNLEIRTSRESSPSRIRSNSRARTPTASSRPKPTSAKTYPPQFPLRSQTDDNKVEFPSSNPRSKAPLEPIQLNTAPVNSEYFIRPRAISNPRSRAPSLRSTPAGRRTQQRPITPSTSSFRPQPLQRASSHAGSSTLQSGSWGSIGVPPKSAKKWARTAHLHEVKTLGPLVSAGGRRSRKAGEDVDVGSTRHDRSRDRTPRELEFERENDDFFSSPWLGSSPKSSPVDVTRSQSSPTLANSLLFKPEPSLDDGDVWIDTDSVDGSELEAEQIHHTSSPGDVKPVSSPS